MVKIIIGTCAAALITSVGADSGAISQVKSGIPSAAIKSNGIEATARAAACSQFVWSYDDSTCLYHARTPGGEAPKVRLVSTDQLLPRDPRRDRSQFDNLF